ncbi:MAG: TRAP transporter small permease [Casimicrobiaceae bacterium]
MSMFGRLVRRLSRLGIAVAALSLLTSLALVVYSVAMRYVFNLPVPWVDELVGYLLVACVMLAAADALIEGEHIAVDAVTERLSARGRRWTLIAGMVAVAASALLLVVEGWGMVAFSRMVDLLSNGYLALPMWIPQAFVPVGAVLLLLAALVVLVDALQGRPPPGDRRDKPAGIE